MEWRFPHPVTGWPCIASYDGMLLTVEADQRASGVEPGFFGNDEDLDDEDEDPCCLADALLFESGLARTACANEAAVVRELRAVGVDGSYLS